MLVPALLKEGHKITVVDNFMYKQNSLAPVCENKNFQYYQWRYSKHGINEDSD